MRPLLHVVTAVGVGLLALATLVPLQPPGALVPPDRPAPPLPPGVEELRFAQLSSFELTDSIPRKPQPLPPEVQALDGRRVRLMGHLIATRRGTEGLTELLLSATSPDCCFGRPPRLNELVRVVPPAGQSAVPRKGWVTGRLTVGPERDPDGRLRGFYRLTADAIE